MVLPLTTPKTVRLTKIFVKKHRLDDLLVLRGLAPDKGKAQKIIMAGEVLVDDSPSSKSGTLVSENSLIRITPQDRFVGRGGDKLEGALVDLNIDVNNKIAIDIGASTGGFTDCLLSRGAQFVYAVDVGTNQLDWKLRNDPRIKALEGTNARNIDTLPSDTFSPAPSLAVIDVSFISVTLILPALLKILSRPAEVLVLVKPQFELPREEVQEGGVVLDPALHEKAWRSIVEFSEKLGGRFCRGCPSRIKGARKGNQEHFIYIVFE